MDAMEYRRVVGRSLHSLNKLDPFFAASKKFDLVCHAINGFQTVFGIHCDSLIDIQKDVLALSKLY